MPNQDKAIKNFIGSFVDGYDIEPTKPTLLKGTHYLKGDIIVPDGIEKIGARAFEDYTTEKITSITFPATIKSISYRSNLKNLDVPYYFTTKKEYDEVYKNTIKEMKKSGIDKNDIQYLLPSYSHLPNVHFTKEPEFILDKDALFKYNSKNPHPVVPSKVSTIGSMAFSGNNKIKTVTLPQNLKTISKSAFRDCKNLAFVEIPSKVASIGEFAFENCVSLESIKIPDGIAEIKKGAFDGCEKLKTVEIPVSLESIDKSIFLNCHNLEKFIVDPNNPNYSTDEQGVLYNKDKTELILYPPGKTDLSFVVPDTVKTIGEEAFYRSQHLTSLTIPDNVTTINKNAFSRSEALENVSLSNGITKISEDAFSFCKKLKQITIPESVTSIGKNAFYGCEKLASVTLPANLKTIENGAFSYCKENINIHFPSTKEMWDDLLKNSSYTGLNLHESDRAFRTVSYPSTEYIHNHAAMIHLSDFKFSCNVFVEYTGSNKTFSVPEGFAQIGLKAFKNCESLESITLPNSIVAIGREAFNGCVNLADIHLNNKINLINESAFQDCSSLQSIRLPDSITKIDKCVFSGCTKLENITLPKEIKKIDDNAFAQCSSLTSISFPVALKKVGNYVFDGCSSLTDIHYEGTQKQQDRIKFDIFSFNGIEKDVTIHNTSEENTKKSQDNEWGPSLEDVIAEMKKSGEFDNLPDNDVPTIPLPEEECL